MEIYEMIIQAIREYWKDNDYETLFLTGGCYWFALKVAQKVPNAYLMINRNLEHCAVMVDNHLCDITGSISRLGYVYAEEKDLNYMKKNYIPNFDQIRLAFYIDSRLDKWIDERKRNRTYWLNCNN